MDIITKALVNHTRTAIATTTTTHSYGGLLHRAASIATDLLRNPHVGATETRPGVSVGARVALLLPPGPDYVAATWAAWLTGSTVVPLSVDHPREQLEYYLTDCTPAVLIANQATQAHAQSLSGIHLHVLPDAPHTLEQQTHNMHTGETHQGGTGARGQSDTMHGTPHDVLQEAVDRGAAVCQSDTGCLIIYTSGTTGKPKGVLHTHRSVMNQVNTLVNAWAWQPSDRMLHALPLHHVHGIVNGLYCPLAAGGTVECLPKFSPTAVWAALMRPDPQVTVFQGVPTMYAYLLEHYASHMDDQQRAHAEAAARRLRLTVCGSAACSPDIIQRWSTLSGQTLLERYGMSEAGMILSNPFEGERRPACVGLPLPGVHIKVDPPTGPGELCVASASVFAEYWNRPGATMEAFDSEGYFKTGDVVQQVGDPPYWQVVGRASIDIIKCKGYKLSALDIERALSSHPLVKDVGVVGVPDDVQGERVVAYVVCGGGSLTLEDVQTFLQSHLPPYSIPTRLELVEALPYTLTGKMDKKKLKELAAAQCG